MVHRARARNNQLVGSGGQKVKVVGGGVVEASFSTPRPLSSKFSSYSLFYSTSNSTSLIYYNLLVADTGGGDDVFIIRLRDLWRKRWNVDVNNESCICSLYSQLEQLEHAKQSQQSPTQVVLMSCAQFVHLLYLSCT